MSEKLCRMISWNDVVLSYLGGVLPPESANPDDLSDLVAGPLDLDRLPLLLPALNKKSSAYSMRVLLRTCFCTSV